MLKLNMERRTVDKNANYPVQVGIGPVVIEFIYSKIVFLRNVNWELDTNLW